VTVKREIESIGMAIAVLLCLPAGLLHAEQRILPAPGSDGWHPMPLPKVERHTKYTVGANGDAGTIRAESHCSASAMILPLDGIDLRRTPRLAWRWKVERGPAIADEQVKSGDDFAARVYVMFRFDREHASFWEKMRHGLGTKLYGSEVPGNAVNYVWTSNTPPGKRWANPFTSASKMISLQRGAASDWHSEEVDVAADYTAFFGVEPPPLLALAVMSDSDNSCQDALAYFADFRFTSAPANGR